MAEETLGFVKEENLEIEIERSKDFEEIEKDETLAVKLECPIDQGKLQKNTMEEGLGHPCLDYKQNVVSDSLKLDDLICESQDPRKQTFILSDEVKGISEESFPGTVGALKHLDEPQESNKGNDLGLGLQCFQSVGSESLKCDDLTGRIQDPRIQKSILSVGVKGISEISFPAVEMGQSEAVDMFALSPTRESESILIPEVPPNNHIQQFNLDEYYRTFNDSDVVKLRQSEKPRQKKGRETKSEERPRTVTIPRAVESAVLKTVIAAPSPHSKKSSLPHKTISIRNDRAYVRVLWRNQLGIELDREMYDLRDFQNFMVFANHIKREDAVYPELKYAMSLYGEEKDLDFMGQSDWESFAPAVIFVQPKI